MKTSTRSGREEDAYALAEKRTWPISMIMNTKGVIKIKVGIFPKFY
tara:strand:- start:99 stop:236 length:138 start_codon:yes stop_codon:yes gene_type:complete